jgi:cell division protein FtsA
MLSKLKALKNAANKARGGKSKDIEYIVALDIGTEFVKALVAKVSGDDLKIIGVGRKKQQLTDMQAGAVADIAGVVKNCDDALNEAEEQAGVSVRTAVIGIAGELVSGTTTTVHCKRKNPDQDMNEQEVAHIIGLVQDRAQQRAKKRLADELGGKDVDISLINSALVRIDIDGYQVSNPVGFKGNEVVVQLYTAFAPLIHIGALEKVANELDLDLLAVAAEPFAVARSVIGNDPNKTTSAILMDVGGGTTDIAVMNDGGVQGTQMFGIGGRAYTRSIERKAGISFARAEELKLLFSNGKLPSDKQAVIKAALENTLDVWIGGVELALDEFDQLDHLPHSILLCGGGASLSILAERLKMSNWYKDLPFSQRPSIKYIQPDDVVGISDKTGDVMDHTHITAMGLLRVGLDTLQVQDDKRSPKSVREKLDRMLRI